MPHSSGLAPLRRCSIFVRIIYTNHNLCLAPCHGPFIPQVPGPRAVFYYIHVKFSIFIFLTLCPVYVPFMPRAMRPMSFPCTLKIRSGFSHIIPLAQCFVHIRVHALSPILVPWTLRHNNTGLSLSEECCIYLRSESDWCYTLSHVTLQHISDKT